MIMVAAVVRVSVLVVMVATVGVVVAFEGLITPPT